MFAGSAEHITDFGTLKTGRVKMADPNCSRCAIEAEVRKDDEALIRQMLEALKQFQYRACESIHPDFVDEAITAGRARLEGKP